MKLYVPRLSLKIVRIFLKFFLLYFLFFLLFGNLQWGKRKRNRRYFPSFFFFDKKCTKFEWKLSHEDLQSRNGSLRDNLAWSDTKLQTEESVYIAMAWGVARGL